MALPICNCKQPLHCVDVVAGSPQQPVSLSRWAPGPLGCWQLEQWIQADVSLAAGYGNQPPP